MVKRSKKKASHSDEEPVLHRVEPERSFELDDHRNFEQNARGAL